MTHYSGRMSEWYNNKYRASYFVCDCEHTGDIERARAEVINAGGYVDAWEWDGRDCGEARVYYHCTTKEDLASVLDKLGDGY